MKRLFQTIESWRQTKEGLIVFIIMEAALIYLFGSLAIDSGSLFDYALTFLLVVLIIQDAVALVLMRSKKASADRPKPTAKKSKDRD